MRLICFLYAGGRASVLAFELASRLPPQARTNLQHLFLTDSHAPNCLRLQNLDNRSFFEELRQLDGRTAEVLDNRELMSLLLLMLSADFTLIENHQPQSVNMLDTDITPLAGDSDDGVIIDAVADWIRFTRGSFEMHVLSGDHFFLRLLLCFIAEVSQIWPAERASPACLRWRAQIIVR
ncbi:thioesterase domain-containing protein (plasmid) [Candidatus Fukatsuia symbiotica]|uniref:Thioesterase domain-containing protein n=1 Tax=Candidatus Fukatsuia symbiotica TaxID=1878942 RepID=A0A2U8IB08_9GAMM|nr:thioesterase domain-containing protein [Candidatus Fukatsuia symbiotica]AWK15524.1 hypothetical protein CCS41_13925 [Candidatus Fukatsuia symbiotica]MEA9445912.1 thioesterase domain-containing protein [Candidatus Fukatsuia symbiotica]